MTWKNVPNKVKLSLEKYIYPSHFIYLIFPSWHTVKKTFASVICSFPSFYWRRTFMNSLLIYYHVNGLCLWFCVCTFVHVTSILGIANRLSFPPHPILICCFNYRRASFSSAARTNLSPKSVTISNHHLGEGAYRICLQGTYNGENRNRQVAACKHFKPEFCE